MDPVSRSSASEDGQGTVDVGWGRGPRAILFPAAAAPAPQPCHMQVRRARVLMPQHPLHNVETLAVLGKLGAVF